MKTAANNVLPISTGKCHQYETQLLCDTSPPDELVTVGGRWVGRIMRNIGPQGYCSTCDVGMGFTGTQSSFCLPLQLGPLIWKRCLQSEGLCEVIFHDIPVPSLWLSLIRIECKSILLFPSYTNESEAGNGLGKSKQYFFS